MVSSHSGDGSVRRRGPEPTPPMSPRPKKVLLLTNSEHGQANVYLAVSHALLDHEEPVEVHLASFAPIAKFVKQTSDYAQQTSGHGRSIVFHEIPGIDMHSAWSRPEIILGDQSTHANTRGLFTAAGKVRVLLNVTMPWTGPEFVGIYRSIVEIIQDVRPDIIAADPAFSPALTACRHLRVKFVILTPNTIKDFSMPLQPRAEALWKYPCTGSGIPFPVPWYLIPFNIYLIFVAIWVSIFDSRRRHIERYVYEHTAGTRLVTLNDLSLNPRLGIKFLVANLPEIEFPLKVIPKHIIPCGPMVRPAKSVAEVDPDLAAWLSKGPTVYINLGTHVLMREEGAVEMATALRIVLDHARTVVGKDVRMDRLQVLWKLTRNTREGDYPVHEPKSRIHHVLGRYMDQDVVRIVQWLEPEPTAILEDPNIVCAVHHGGANSFLETVSAGKPHVVLPVWIDTFDFASRAELLGIGLWGNRTSRPACKAFELGPALRDVLIGDDAPAIKKRAEALARLCAGNGGGRVAAARAILAEIEPQEVPCGTMDTA